jgi:hypothetical protein
MKRLAVLTGTFLMLCTLAGCGSNPREAAINEALGFFETAASNTDNVAKAIDEAVAAAQKRGDKLTEKDLKPAIDAAKKLRDVGEQLAGSASKKLPGLKSQIDILQENTTPQQKERLASEYQDRLSSLVKRLVTAHKKLDESLDRAERQAPPAVMAKLRDELRASREDMYILSRPH